MNAIEGVSCIRFDQLVTTEFLTALTPLIPAKTELWWTASAGIELLRDAFVEAFRLQKLVRVDGTSHHVLLEWPFYGLRFRLTDLGALPTLSIDRVQ
jgi:hypothetical protein